MSAPAGRKRPPLMPSEPLWYKDAIIYELRVRSFYDGDGDGMGDFRGLAEKLDYLQDLGVTALWLLPFYPSPGRDDGYDTADYLSVHPEVGTLHDFKHFLDEAHRRGLRVITELVLNHTSDQHPWFQRARRAPAGSRERNFYVWADTAEPYKDARIIFKDFETSNWTWDPVAKAYFWHRFFAHQPDLNFESEEVQNTLLSVVDFWFELGVDGLRLDAVPYLYEREGTSCENLPETHAFLRRLRAHVDARYEDRMLLAEANQWPEDAVAYFGNDDECHMAFHFPIMPRLYMAIHMEDRFPILDILAQTPAIGPTCQWALFLRNHDELTLEMVTDEERDAMYSAYAAEPTMRINLGIRRRLAPLVGNDRRVIELMNALLFSLPGTPVLYYGDEIGMGDNVFLGDRNGVRTPMQWSADRNAGFSRANPQRLVLPVITDPHFHYEAINVEAAQQAPQSLLWWTKRLIALRKRSRAFGRGSIDFLSPDNPRVLAFVREHEGEVVLIVANLSRFVQHARLDLGKYKGLAPIELFGRSKLPEVDDQPYPITLGPHGCFWFSLERTAKAERALLEATHVAKTFELTGSAGSSLASAELRAALEDALPDWLRTRAWFDRAHEPALTVELEDAVALAHEPFEVGVAMARVSSPAGAPMRVLTPVAIVSGADAEGVRTRMPASVIVNLRGGALGEAVVFDALSDPRASGALLDAMLAGGSHRTKTGELAVVLAPVVLAPSPSPSAAPSTVRGPRESFTSEAEGRTSLVGEVRAPREVRVAYASTPQPELLFGDGHALRVYLRLPDTQSVEVDLGLFFAERPGLDARVPRFVSHAEQRSTRAGHATVMSLRHLPHAEADAWKHARGELGRFFQRVLARAEDGPTAIDVLDSEPLHAVGKPIDPQTTDALGGYLALARLLGTRIGELHLALASDSDSAFKPEAFSPFDQRSSYQSMRNLSGRVLRSLGPALEALDETSRLHPPDLARPETARGDAEFVLARGKALLDRFEVFLAMRLTSLRIRCHGDLHLGRVLFTGSDFVVRDLEGDPAMSVSDRKRKRSPLRDVAAAVRSLHYAAFTSVVDPAFVRPEDVTVAEAWAEKWHVATGSALVEAYLARTAGASFLPRQESEAFALLDVFEIEKALLELQYELALLDDPLESSRAWIPLRRLRQKLTPPGA